MIEPGPQPWEQRVIATGPPEKSLISFFLIRNSASLANSGRVTGAQLKFFFIFVLNLFQFFSIKIFEEILHFF